jgi:hypothetical protein
MSSSFTPFDLNHVDRSVSMPKMYLLPLYQQSILRESKESARSIDLADNYSNRIHSKEINLVLSKHDNSFYM